MESFAPQIICLVIASRDSGQNGSRGLGETGEVKSNESSLECMQSWLVALSTGTDQHRAGVWMGKTNDQV